MALPTAPAGREVRFPRTKFHRAPIREEHVERTGLLTTMMAAPERLVLVSAPPGFGKSTLLAQWAAAEQRFRAGAWVSLDADDVGTRFWAAILESLRDLDLPVEALLLSAGSDDVDLRDAVLVPLLDLLADAQEPRFLVIDDLHVVEDAPTIDALDWVLSRMPGQHRVLIASRSVPPLDSLSRLRLQGDVLDIRVDDLRFADDEVGRFLVGGLGLALDTDAIAALQERFAGWPAALYLAALRLRLGDSVSDVTTNLGSTDTEMIGHLTDEVLRSMPPVDRRFTVEASALDRFNAELCERVLGQDAAAFQRLTNASLLVVALDEDRRWFRFHHLLRDVLQARLAAADPERMRALHLVAGEWFAAEGDESEQHEAVQHFVAARAWDQAAELLARHAITFVQSGALGIRARLWIDAVPGHVVRADARLCFVAALLAGLDGDSPRLERHLDAGAGAGWAGPMPDGTPSFALAALALRGMLVTGGLDEAVLSAREALERLPPGGDVRAMLAAFTSWHLYLVGDIDGAEALARETALAHARGVSGALPLVATLPTAVLGLAALERGDIEVARLLCERAVAVRDLGALGYSRHALPVTCAAARLATLEGDPAAAVRICRRGLELAQDWRGSSLMVPSVLLELARAHAALGDVAGLAEAQRAARIRLMDVADAGRLPAELDALGARARPSLRSTPGVEELSEREYEVLRALTGAASLREIASNLFISHNTIKTHVRTLYAKLGVDSREAATARGRELGLLTGKVRP
jgi:LuxR family maltose regulon positive regulatory protein